MLTVNEVFFSIQGEGSRAGRPCVFVRLTGCPLRCVWCDTAYAFHEGARRGEEELLAELRLFPSRLLCLTGGEPLAQSAAFPFVSVLLDEGWEVVVETSGHVPIGPLDPRAVAILDVKTPGSGESARMDWSNLERLRAKDEVKFVIDGRADYEWSRGMVADRGLASRCTVLFSPVHGVLDPGTLGRWILDDGLAVRLQVQLHKYLWPGGGRGV
ncbi:MAG TPA: radical SAM protein [Vicinamibacteria bacterium]|nr:radical SAM protein [Vicinamibacteria bacterium]